MYMRGYLAPFRSFEERKGIEHLNDAIHRLLLKCMKIYTRQGDDGTTGLFGGKRVLKADARIECYGTVDELNASLGLAVASISEPPHPALGELAARLRRVQNDLFAIGAYLATPDPAAVKSLPPLPDAMVAELETEIDAAEADLTPLRQFILPGGSAAAARLHAARTICRRAERLLVAFEAAGGAEIKPPPVILAYMNRLGDWLFVQARWVNHRLGVADVPWVKRT
jgi:cob(I)alamin adenosyltransferase